MKEALEAYGKPEGPFFVRVFAEAGLVSGLRQFLRNDWGLDNRSSRLSGFWRRGRTLSDQARMGYSRIDAMVAEGKVVDEEAFSKFLEYD